MITASMARINSLKTYETLLKEAESTIKRTSNSGLRICSVTFEHDKNTAKKAKKYFQDQGFNCYRDSVGLVYPYYVLWIQW